MRDILTAVIAETQIFAVKSADDSGEDAKLP